MDLDPPAVVEQLTSAGIPATDPSRSEPDPAWPENSIAEQSPLVVVRPRDAGELGGAVRMAGESGLQTVVQATGHGASRALGAETMLIDTRDLAAVRIDPTERTATVGAGAVWGDVQRQAEQHGLLGLVGTSPRVGVSGYTFGGGVGWLTRPHGLAADALRSVEFVDDVGVHRIASDDAPDEADRSAIRAFRGGLPVGIAVAVTFDLVPVPNLFAGYLLWSASDADAVIAAWAAVLDDLPPGLTSTIALLHVPPEGPFPDELLGTVVAHLSFATPNGPDEATVLLDAVRSAATPVVDTAGPCDVERLGGIHLDPPPGNPSIGDGRWLDAGTAASAGAILGAAGVGDDDGLAMVELRHVAGPGARRDGVLTETPAPFLWQGIGPAGGPDAIETSLAALQRVREVSAPFDIGRSFRSFRTGQDPED